MKRFLVSAIALLAVSTAVEAQINMPQPSPLQHIRQDFGMGRIEITYSRPSVKGRSMFKDNSDLAPLGKLWRTGANAATRIRFTDKVTIGGTTIDTGSYSIFTIPQKNEWEVIFNKNANASVNDYKQSEDVVRVKAQPKSLKNTAENFTIQVNNITNETADLELMWGKTVVTVPIKTDVRDRLRGQLEAALQSDRKPYFPAANFYYEFDKNYDKALENVNKAIEASPKAFWMYMLKARIQKDMGDKAGARTTAQQVVTLATEQKNDDYVRMANDLMKKI
ncbi:DUF2911 domain-containing protein [Aridibaculum aurantiacum]|uniref:DUF2911 domain-containing protein n=1 Tax=Aridibaculum aurantiacum TaxID=2810307 RepID=UPI001A96BEBD|nr:DUF2911 domain-containing protein [Aridibaculum aurantiacum]